jgi:REP element-mobilizing transposase RayT
MPHRITPFFSGGYYHIFNRGNNRQPIFFERENYFYFLRQLQNTLSSIRWKLLPIA